MANDKLMGDAKRQTLVGILQDKIIKCQKMTEPMLHKQKELLAQYANGWFSEFQLTSPRSRNPLNMVSRAVNLLLPLLASRNPRAMVRPRIVQLKPFADTLRLTLNHLTDEIELGNTLREAVLYALVYMGVTKTGISTGGKKVEDAYGYLHDSGQIFCDLIYPEDYFFDTSARKKEEMDFEGNIFYVPFDYITDSGLFKNYDKLAQAYTNWDKNSAKKVADEKNNLFLDTIKPYVKLAEVWIPSENIVITIPLQGEGTEPLRVVDYNGPEKGPYDTLSFGTFPESIIPVPPLYTNLDLHYLINIMARKMARQANREKQILAYQDEETGEAIKVANDGDTVKVPNVNTIKELRYGGTADQSYTWIEWLCNKWTQGPTNMNLLGGLQAKSPTLGQDQMLAANASAYIDDMIFAVHNLVKSIYTKAAYYIFTDPALDVTISKRLAGMEDVQVKVSPETREGDFWEYNFDVEPYSMQRTNPQVRSQKIMGVVNGLILPTIQYAAQQGASLDIVALVKQVCRDMDLTDSEIDEIYHSVAFPPNTNMGPYQPSKGMSGGLGDQQGASPASREANLTQQQNRAGGESSPPNSPAGEAVGG